MAYNITQSLRHTDMAVYQALCDEERRQQTQLELIASENFTSRAVMEACGSVFTNKYAEGYPYKRYYGGCENMDMVEELAIQRAKELFNCAYANVQPHSGAQANQAVFLALLSPGDTILGMNLNHGGHLTHGSKVNLSGKWFHTATYGVNLETGLINMDRVAAQARTHKPKLIIAGASAYARVIDFEAFRRIADQVGAYLLVDMAHYAGLVAAGVYPSPLPYAHVVTSTTHKTLRGPRGGIILSNDEKLGQKFNSAVFPGLQGGPLMHIIAGKAVAFKEALDPAFATYGEQIIKNAQALATTLIEGKLKVVSGGTDSHVVLVDLTPLDIDGATAEQALEKAGLTCNKNGIPGDKRPPVETSGIRLGTPALTTRGFKEKEFRQIGKWILDILQAKKKGQEDELIPVIRDKISALCQKFPLY